MAPRPASHPEFWDECYVEAQMANSVGPLAGLPAFESQLSHFPAVWPWASYFTPLGLSFAICGSGEITVLPSHSVMQVQ